MSFQLIGGDTKNIDQVVNQVNQNIAQLKTQDVTNVFKDDTGTRRVLLGKGKDDFYGLKVSKPGFDVFDATNAQLMFSSDLGGFKVIDEFELEFPHLSGVYDTEKIYTHNLGFKPVFFGYLYDPTNNVWEAMPTIYVANAGANSGKVRLSASAYVTSTTLNYLVNIPDWNTSTFNSNITYQLKFFLLQEAIQL